MVREVAVDLGVHLAHVAAQRTQHARRRRARDAVARIDHDLHRPRELGVAGDARGVFGPDVHLGAAALALRVVLGLDAPAQRLDLVAVDRTAGQHHLEAVVVLRVVAAGDLDARAAAVRAARGGHVVQHRCRHRTEVDHVQPGRCQPADQRRGQARAREAPVAPHRHRLFAGLQRLAAESPAEVLGKGLVDRLADDAADVIGLEDGGIDLHGVNVLARGCGHCRQRRAASGVAHASGPESTGPKTASPRPAGAYDAAHALPLRSSAHRRRTRPAGPVCSAAGARCTLRRPALRGRHVDRRVLPPGVPCAHADAAQLPLLRPRRRRPRPQGFRPCLRCRPELAPGLSLVDGSPQALAQHAARPVRPGRRRWQRAVSARGGRAPGGDRPPPAAHLPAGLRRFAARLPDRRAACCWPSSCSPTRRWR